MGCRAAFSVIRYRVPRCAGWLGIDPAGLPLIRYRIPTYDGCSGIEWAGGKGGGGTSVAVVLAHVVPGGFTFDDVLDVDPEPTPGEDA